MTFLRKWFSRNTTSLPAAHPLRGTRSGDPSDRFLWEDLDDDEVRQSWLGSGTNVLPWVTLVGLVAAALGIGWSLAWLASPPGYRPATVSRSSESTGSQTENNPDSLLADLPLIPVAPSDRATGQNPFSASNRPHLRSLEDLAASPELATDATPSTSTERVESLNVAYTTPAGPRVESLGSSMGEGVYLVLMDYRGELSLQQARQYASGAFVKQVNGSPYVQIAAFRQLEYARHLADTLRGEGYTVVIAQ